MLLKNAEMERRLGDFTSTILTIVRGMIHQDGVPGGR